MFTHINYIMVNVSDMKRSVAFYRDQLGLPLKFDSDYWTEFNTGSSTLALHWVLPASSKPTGTGPGTCHLGFSVPDLQKAYESLKAKGVSFVMPPTDQPQEGIKLAICLDPDGLSVSFAESLRP